MYLVSELAGVRPERLGRKVCALSRIAASTAGSLSCEKPQNSRLLPSSRLPDALIVAVKVIAISASGFFAGLAFVWLSTL